MQRTLLPTLLLVLGLGLSTGTTHGDEIGHYTPGLPNIRDLVMPQLGLTYVLWVASLNMHYFGEFAARGRFQGQVFGVSVAKKF